MKTVQKKSPEYDFKQISIEQNKIWKERNVYYCDVSQGKSKFYALGMFPYPSGNAHMGHVRVYTIVDIKGRFKRLKGSNVLNPLGWDAFGLPAENAAILNKVMPATWTDQNIDRMKDEQFVDMGWSFDMSKELTTCSPDYYRWTQWIFLQFLKRGLAYRAKGMVNWCPVDQTVLANEQVIEGKCWRDGAPVEKREMLQWFFKITDYAERLWNDISNLKNWAPEAVSVQKNWINQSQGTRATFAVPALNTNIEVFTTRIDTLFGVTALVVAPEHPLVQMALKKTPNAQVATYVEASLKRSAVDRMASKDKTGVPVGIEAMHPLTGKPVPVWTGDYVLGDYGTGAVMCVPAHDQRDYEFAHKMHLDVVEVIQSTSPEAKKVDEAFCDDGVLVASGDFSGMTSAQARGSITERLEQLGKGQRMVTYNLRDWSVGRQRYWGCPIPIIYCDSCGTVPVPEKDLPVLLPTDISLENGKASLVNHPTFKDCVCPQCQSPARRETDTLDTFICSSWYAFRYVDPQNTQAIFDSKKVNDWLPIDFYVGGLEHAAQHMIYFRFFTKFFKDIGLVQFDEPVDQFYCNGMVLKDGSKMSKSKGNIVVPTEVVEKYGADALRLYIMSDTPADMDIDWNDDGIKAKLNFLRRCYRPLATFLAAHEHLDETKAKLEKFSHGDLVADFYSKLQQLEQQIESNSFNSGVARLYEMSNVILKAIPLVTDGSEDDRLAMKLMIKHFIISFSVFVPYFSESLYAYFTKPKDSIYQETWPEVDRQLTSRDSVNVVVQINGRKRAVLVVPKGTPGDTIEQMVDKDAHVQSFLEGKVVQKKIYVQDKIYSIVATE